MSSKQGSAFRVHTKRQPTSQVRKIQPAKAKTQPTKVEQFSKQVVYFRELKRTQRYFFLSNEWFAVADCSPSGQLKQGYCLIQVNCMGNWHVWSWCYLLCLFAIANMSNWPYLLCFFVGHCSASHSLMATIAAKCICIHARPHLNLLFAYGQHAHLYQKMPLNFGREKSPFIASAHQQSASLIAMSFQSLKAAVCQTKTRLWYQLLS